MHMHRMHHRYDKSAYAGRGDRAPQSSWPVVQGPLEVVLFEGWMSGFAPVEDAQVRVGAVSHGNRMLVALTDPLALRSRALSRLGEDRSPM